MSDMIEVRVPRLPAIDLDYIRRHARARGCPNTATAAVRFAVEQLAQRLRREDQESDEDPDPAAGSGIRFNFI